MTGNAKFDVAIAGGGIVGCACALACARRGLRVALVERDVLGSGATAAGMGHIVVMDDSEAQFVLTRYSQELWRKLDLRVTSEYLETGTLWLAADHAELEAAERKHASYRERSVPCRLLTSQGLAIAEPNLATVLAGALLVSQDAVVYPIAVALELANRAERLGAQILVGRVVKSMGHGVLLLSDGTEIHAERLVNALGAEASAVMPNLPVRKRKGHLVITDRYPGFVRHQLVELGYLKSAHGSEENSVAFNVQPRQTGQLLIGSSRQFGDESTNVDQQILSSMLARAALYLPGVNELNAIRVWTGFRAATPDKLPLIGPSTEDETIWLATGHEGLGITTSLATAELIAAGLTGGKSPIDSQPYLPARFGKPAPNTNLGEEKLCTGPA